MSTNKSPMVWPPPSPQRYRYVPLGALTTEVRAVNEGGEWTNRLSLSYGEIVPRDVMSVDGLLPASFETYNRVQKDDIVLRLTDLQNDRTSLRSGLVTQPGIVTSAYVSLRPAGIDPRFLAYYLRATDLSKLFYSLGGGLRQSIGFGDLKKLRVPVPPGSEQRAIVNYLDHETAEIDAFIQDQETFSALIGERQRARTFDLATGGSSDGKIGDSYVSLWSGVPNDWSMQKLGWHFKIGNGSTPKSDNPRYWSDDGFPWVNSSVVNEDTVVTPSRYVSEDALHELHLPIVPSGSLLIGLTGQGKTRGTVTTLRIETTVNQHVAYMIPRKDSVITTEYLRLALEASYWELRDLSDGAGGTKGALTCEMIAQYRIPVPPLEDQNRLVSQHRANQTKVILMLDDARLAITLAKERRAALISAAVTGQIDVTQKRRPVSEVLEDDVGVRV